LLTVNRTQPRPAQLVLGIIASNTEWLAAAEAVLAQQFGPIALKSAIIPFDFTDYYEKEMGSGLLRRWVCCQGLVEPEKLARLKLQTCELEHQFRTENHRRRVNLDPGLLSLHNLVLASTKEFGHRIYLGSGIYAEVTLIYQNGRFQPLEWTYPDYRTPVCLDFLAAGRKLLTLSLAADR